MGLWELCFLVKATFIACSSSGAGSYPFLTKPDAAIFPPTFLFNRSSGFGVFAPYAQGYIDVTKAGAASPFQTYSSIAVGYNVYFAISKIQGTCELAQYCLDKPSCRPQALLVLFNSSCPLDLILTWSQGRIFAYGKQVYCSGCTMESVVLNNTLQTSGWADVTVINRTAVNLDNGCSHDIPYVSLVITIRKRVYLASGTNSSSVALTALREPTIEGLLCGAPPLPGGPPEILNVTGGLLDAFNTPDSGAIVITVANRTVFVYNVTSLTPQFILSFTSQLRGTWDLPPERGFLTAQKVTCVLFFKSGVVIAFDTKGNWKVYNYESSTAVISFAMIPQIGIGFLPYNFSGGVLRIAALNFTDLEFSMNVTELIFPSVTGLIPFRVFRNVSLDLPCISRKATCSYPVPVPVPSPFSQISQMPHSIQLPEPAPQPFAFPETPRLPSSSPHPTPYPVIDMVSIPPQLLQPPAILFAPTIPQDALHPRDPVRASPPKVVPSVFPYPIVEPPDLRYSLPAVPNNIARNITNSTASSSAPGEGNIIIPLVIIAACVVLVAAVGGIALLCIRKRVKPKAQREGDAGWSSELDTRRQTVDLEAESGVQTAFSPQEFQDEYDGVSLNLSLTDSCGSFLLGNGVGLYESDSAEEVSQFRVDSIYHDFD